MAQINQQFINKVKEVISNQPIPPKYNLVDWTDKRFNCYTYAMRICIDFSDYRKWICPGFISKGAENDCEYTKESIIKNFLEDCECLGLKALATTLSAKIQKDEYKIAVYVKEGVDFHFARQDSNGKWSEKSGWHRTIERIKKRNVTKDEDGYDFIGVFRVSRK